MNRKSMVIGFGVVLLLASAVTGLALLVRHEPEFYRHTALPAGDVRKQHSREFVGKFLGLVNSIMDKRYKDKAGDRFSTEQINSYLSEDFARSGSVLPEGISEPRLVLDTDKLRLAFRYGTEPWSTVISIDLRVWLVPTELNVVALELLGMRAGALPIYAQSLLERVSEAARRQNVEVTWYRHNGHPVALVRFQADRPTPTIHLQRLELYPGEILICGCSIEALKP